MTLRLLWLLGACLAALASAPARAAEDPGSITLADGTIIERWTLANGLRVTTRHVPGARAAAVTLGFRVGTANDPPGREGISLLLSELMFTGPAGDVPARRLAEMDELRAEGWDLQTATHFTLLAEVATREQLPGVLSQFAARLRGVNVDRVALKQTVASMKAQLAERYFGPPSQSLYQQVRELGLHGDDQLMVRKAGGKGFERATVKEIRDRLAKLYVPANAVLSVAGNLEGVDLRAIVQSLFGNVPAGSPIAEMPAPVLSPRARVMKRTDLDKPVGVIAVIAPAVDDSLHPSFYVGTLVLGGLCKDVWGDPAPLISRFRYSLFGAPELALFFPPANDTDPDTDGLAVTFDALVTRLRSSIVNTNVYERLRDGLIWQFGAPLSPKLLERAKTESPALHTLATGAAARTLWMGEAFWEDYLRRLELESAGTVEFIAPYIGDPSNQVRLLFTPGNLPVR
ncbi:MAG TPA: insulinase family protein [Candidatus Limnocylindria bacterium]|nr:insulinase family protein [Candidatus Limnocylindria bacterium]